jgi:hypothetical protein
MDKPTHLFLARLVALDLRAILFRVLLLLIAAVCCRVRGYGDVLLDFIFFPGTGSSLNAANIPNIVLNSPIAFLSISILLLSSF